MKKIRCSFCLNEQTLSLIDEAATRNNISRSAVIRMFVDLANYLPPESLKLTSPVPALLGLKKEVTHSCS